MYCVIKIHVSSCNHDLLLNYKNYSDKNYNQYSVSY